MPSAMHRLERSRKFHNAIVNMLFPPPSSSENEDEKDQANKFKDFSDADVFRDSDAIGDSSSTSSPESENEGEGEDSKILSRAQRKRLRKKKLREAASSRTGKIIGPMLPSASGDYVPVDCPQGIRRNVCEEPNAAAASAATARFETSALDGSGQLGACHTTHTLSKLKQRRKAKRLARESTRSSMAENSGQDNESSDRGTCCAEQVSNEKSTKTPIYK